MAAPSQSRAPDSRNYVEYEEYVDFQLEKTRAIVKRTDILTTVMALAVGVVGYLLAFVVCDQWIIEGGFGYTARVILLTGVMAVVVGTLIWRVVLPLVKHVHPLYAARVIEKSDPKLQSNLVNFVDVKLANAESAPVVLKSMQKRAAVELSHIDVEEAVDHRPLLRIAYVLLGVVVVAAVYIFWSPKDVFVSVRRALLPTSSVPVATKTTISDVDPGSKDVPARTRQLITAEVRGEEADLAHILFTTADHKYVDEPVRMRRESPGLAKFVGELNGENGKGLLQSLTYRIVAGDARSTDYVLNVIQPPSARVDEVQYVFPKYTELGDKTTSGGDIDGWEGTIVTVKATANMKVARAWIVMTDSDEKGGQGEDISMQVAEGTALTCSWKLEFRRDGTAPRYYHIRVRTEDQRKDEIDSDPTQYALRIRPDQRPDVALLDPTGDLVRPANAVIPLAVQASDPDFKVRSVVLRGTRGGDSLFNQDVKLFEDALPARTVAGRYDFRLEPLRLKQGEKIQIWIEAKDNKQPTANRTNTTAVNITIDKPVSAEEAEKLLAEDKKVQEEQLQRSDPANNPDGKDKEPQEPQVGENRDDQPQPGRERPDPALAQPKDAADQRNNQGDEPGDEAAAGDDKNAGRRQRKPVDGDEALRRLLKKQPVTEQEQQNPDEDSDPQASPDRVPQERGDGEGEGQGGRDKSKKHGQKNSDQSQTGQEPGREKDSSGDRQQDDANSGDEVSASKQDDATDKNSRGNSKQNKANSKSGDKNQTGEKDQTGDKGASRKETGDKPAPGDGKGEKEEQSPAGTKPGEKEDEGSTPTKPDGSPAAKKNDKGNNKSDADRPAGDKGDKGDKQDQQSGKGPDEKDPGPNPDGSGEGEKPADDQKNPQQKNQQRGGADSKKADKSEAGGNSKDKSQGGGTPGESDKNDNDADSQEGQSSGGDKSPKAGKDPKKPGDGSDSKGPEKPATDDGTAKDKTATGNEEGEATVDEGDGNRERPRASDKVKKKDGTQQGSKKDGSGEEGDRKKDKQKRGPEEGAEGGTDDAEHADRPPDGKKPGERPGKLEDPPSEKGVERTDRPDNKRPGEPPDVGNEKVQGDGRKDGQKSENPDSGEDGGGAASDQGESGANKLGPGDKSDEPGNTDSAKDKTSQKGSKNKGKGSATKPSDGESGKEEGDGGEKPGDKPSGQNEKGAKSGNQGPGKEGGDEQGEAGDGKAGGKPAGKSAGKKSGSESGKSGEAGQESGSESGAKDGSAKGSKPGKPGSGQQRSGSGLSSNPGKGDQPGEGENPDGDPAERATRTEPPTAEEDAENLENAKKATNLMLKRLKSQLERGDVDQEMLDEMGWKDNKDVAKFVKYLESNLKDTDDDSPDAQARRLQFEETLRNLEVGSETQRRSGSVGQERAIQQIGTKNVPPPREYQKIWESYTRSLSNQGDKPDAKAKASVKTSKDKPNTDKAKKATGKK